MKKVILKRFVLPTMYVLVIGVLFVSISFLGNVLKEQVSYGDMAVGALKENVTPVVKNEEVSSSVISKPYVSSSVSISKSFYDYQDDEVKQQNSLVYYENTYLQNSGVLYTSPDAFDILSVYDGVVSKVSKDDILGEYVEITHNENLKTIYYSLSEVTVKEGDNVISGDVIAKSGENNISSEYSNALLFEVYYNGTAMDPEDFYNLDIEELK